VVTVRDLMASDPITVEPEESLRNAADVLTSSGVSGAAVASNGRVLGVITLTDIVEFEADEPGVPSHRPDLAGPFEEDASEEPELPEEQEPYSRWFVDMWEDAGADLTTRFEARGPEWDSLDDHTVEEVMSRTVLSVPPDAEVREAAELMEKRSVHRLLVMNGDELVGILSAWDIVRAVAQGQLVPPEGAAGRAA
jgi:CBS domain-containing protein